MRCVMSLYALCSTWHHLGNLQIVLIFFSFFFSERHQLIDARLVSDVKIEPMGDVQELQPKVKNIHEVLAVE